MGDAARIQPRVKVPRRTIYFASGETMEEYSTDEEEEEEECTKKDVSTVDTVRARLLTFYSMTRVICLTNFLHAVRCDINEWHLSKLGLFAFFLQIPSIFLFSTVMMQTNLLHLREETMGYFCLIACVWPVVLVSHFAHCVLQSKMTWGPYFWFQMWRMTTSTISGNEVCGITRIHDSSNVLSHYTSV